VQKTTFLLGVSKIISKRSREYILSLITIALKKYIHFLLDVWVWHSTRKLTVVYLRLLEEIDYSKILKSKMLTINLLNC